MDEIKENIAKNITALRIEKGLTQLELAEKLHYSDKAVSKWERAESMPEITTLVNLADIFGVSLDALIRGQGVSVAADKEGSTVNYRVITLLSVLLVWFLAVLVFVVVELLVPASSAHWLTFIFAVPFSSIVWLIFNSIWFDTRKNYLIISILMWSVLASLQLSFLCNGINIWHVYLLGIPGQTVIFLWSRLWSKK